MEHQELIDIALDAGAKKATVIDAKNVVLSATFRDICASNGCGKYGRCWMCPPDIGEIETLMAEVRKYKHGLLYQTIADIEDSFDIEGMQEAGQAHAWLSQRIEAFLMPVLKSICISPAAAAACANAAPRWMASPAANPSRPCRPWRATALTCTTPANLRS